MFRGCTIPSNTSLTRKRGERGWTCRCGPGALGFRTRMAAFSALAGQRPLSSLARQASFFAHTSLFSSLVPLGLSGR